jgi:hypothetical protein
VAGSPLCPPLFSCSVGGQNQQAVTGDDSHWRSCPMLLTDYLILSIVSATSRPLPTMCGNVQYPSRPRQCKLQRPVKDVILCQSSETITGQLEDSFSTNNKYVHPCVQSFMFLPVTPALKTSFPPSAAAQHMLNQLQCLHSTMQSSDVPLCTSPSHPVELSLSLL